MIKTLKEEIRQRLLSQYGNLLSKETLDKPELEAAMKSILDQVIQLRSIDIPEVERKKIVVEMVNELTGFGPLEGVMKDPEITEVMINGHNKIFVEKHGKKVLSEIKFDDEQQLRVFIYKLLAPTRRRVDESFPFVDISLKDGSRVNIIIPPLALDGITVTIRKFLASIQKIEDLIQAQTLDKRMADFLVACIRAKINIIFSGDTGSGKTTTLAVLSGYIDSSERIITIEDTAELHLNQDHVVRLETRAMNIESRGEVTIRDLFINSLRMRPSRIILGEIRSTEALDMLQAMCSGHSGSLAVLHANSPTEVIYRLETMVLTSGVALTLDSIHRQINAAVHLIIQQELISDGTRKITHITQINGIKDDGIVLEDIFNYEIDDVGIDGKVNGRFKATGVIPKFYPLFAKKGINLSKDIFTEG